MHMAYALRLFCFLWKKYHLFSVEITNAEKSSAAVAMDSFGKVADRHFIILIHRLL